MSGGGKNARGEGIGSYVNLLVHMFTFHLKYVQELLLFSIRPASFLGYSSEKPVLQLVA